MLWYTTRATGIVALVLLSATVVLGLMTRRRVSSEGWPRFVLQDLHRRISILSVCFLGIHVLTSVADTYVDIGWQSILVPFTSRYETLSTSGSVPSRWTSCSRSSSRAF
jgi:sulfoxide reductase heme-binding subunit YedZ